jgi:plasmid stability protein
MAQLLIRNVDERTLRRLRKHATSRRQPLEQALRDILVDVAGRLTRAERVARADRIRSMTTKRLRQSTTTLIRADRDRR